MSKTIQLTSVTLLVRKSAPREVDQRGRYFIVDGNDNLIYCGFNSMKAAQSEIQALERVWVEDEYLLEA